MKNDAKKKRESKILATLCRDHGYMFQKLQPKSERFTMHWSYNKRTKKSILNPAVCIKMSVPVDSNLGEKIVLLYKEDDTKKNKKRSKR